MSEKRKSLAEEFASQIIEDLKAGTAPWQKPWKAGELTRPFNPATGTVYKGINSIMLSSRGYADPRWMTFKQAGEQEWQVKKGSKAQRVVFWQWTDRQTVKDDSGQPVTDKEGREIKETVSLERPRFHIYSVFHASQLQIRDGQDIPPYEPRELSWNPNEMGEMILKKSGASISHDQRDRAFYQPADDEIHLPPRENFPDAGNYYATALHELGHWTGHPDRLNREFGPFGSELYAKEELRAEIASWMLSQELGLPHDPSGSLSYVGSWIKALESDPYEIMRASRDAEKIKEHVMGMEKTQAREEQTEIDLQTVNADLDQLNKMGREDWIQEPATAPHLLTRDEFALVAKAVPLGISDKRWEVFIDDTHLGFSAAETAVGAVHDMHHREVDTALYSRTEENKLLPVQAMPSEKVLAEYPDLQAKYADLFAKELRGEGKNQPRLYVVADALMAFVNPENFGDLAAAVRFKSPAAALEEALNMQTLFENRLESGELFIHPIDANGTVEKAVLQTGTRQEMAAQWQQNIGPGLPNFLADLVQDILGHRAKTIEKTYLTVPYKEKEAAKAAGAKWDGDTKSWYAPEGLDMSKIAAWLPTQEKALVASTLSPQDEFGQALEKAGLVVEGQPVMDGQIHRVSVEGGKPGAKDGAYCAYLDGRPNGWCQNYKTGDKEKWIATGQTLTEQQKAALKANAAEHLAERDRGLQERQDKAQKRAYARWINAPDATSGHPYLTAKGVKDFGLKQDAMDNLLVPGFDLKTGRLQTLQRISPEGEKRFEADCPKSGAVCMIPSEDEIYKNFESEILIAEGYATGASLYQATGIPVAVAFDAGNLLNAARNIREKLPLAQITICADDDHNKPINIGIEKANEAALAVGGKVIAPVFTEEEKKKGLTDFNDLYKSSGTVAVLASLGAAATFEKAVSTQGTVKHAVAELER